MSQRAHAEYHVIGHNVLMELDSDKPSDTALRWRELIETRKKLEIEYNQLYYSTPQ